MIDAIIFDCDGVLVDSEIVGLYECAEFLQTHGFSWSAEDLIREFTGMHVETLTRIFREEYTKILGRVPSQEEEHTLFEGFVAQRRLHRHLMTTVPGTEEMSKTLAALNVTVAVASSSQAHFLEDKMARYGLAPYYAPHIYSADLVEKGKPAPDIFLYTAAQIGVAPEKCLVIEDSRHGISAARAANMTAWGFTGGGHCFEGHGVGLEQAGAAKIMTDHQALTQALAEICA